MRVLVVADDGVIRGSIEASLVASGFGVRALADGSALEAELASYQPALVVLDRMLPGRDGTELVRVVRSRSSAGVVMRPRPRRWRTVCGGSTSAWTTTWPSRSSWRSS